MRAPLAIAVVLAAHAAAAEPVGARVLTVPTAWLARSGDAAVMLGLDHRGDGAAIADVGLGDLAELELGSDSDVRACVDCAMRPVPIALGRAAFRLGTRADAAHGTHAIALGVRTTFAARGHAVHEPRASDAYLVASSDFGVVRLHAGIDALSASVGGIRAPARLRPLAGVELHPPMYPRSSLLGDLAWEPTLDAARGPALGWLFGVGVRYQAFTWASVELAVRARQAEELGAATVMVRVNAMQR
jgi:hypothetical protein